MFGTLLETKARRERRPLGTLASVGVHAGVVLLAIWGTASARPPVRTGGIEGILPIEPPASERGPARPKGPRHAGAGPSTYAPPTGPVAPTGVDVTLPTIGGDPALPGDASLLAEIGGSGSDSGSGGNGDAGAVASEWTVDERVGIVSERAPRYPETLRAAGVEGTVIVRFVVDTTGRVDPASVQVLDSPHEQFTAAVLAALRQTHFVPGKIRGRAVPTLVQRSFRFAVEGRP